MARLRAVAYLSLTLLLPALAGLGCNKDRSGGRRSTAAQSPPGPGDSGQKSQPEAVPLHALVAAFGKPADGKEVQAIAGRFPEPPSKSGDGDLVWKARGLRLVFRTGEGMTAAFLYAAGAEGGVQEYLGELPLNVSLRDGRAGVEQKLGPPDLVSGSPHVLATYRKLGLSVGYRPAKDGGPVDEVEFVKLTSGFRLEGSSPALPSTTVKGANPKSPTAPADGSDESSRFDLATKYDGRTLAEWITALGDKDVQVRLQAANALRKYGPAASALRKTGPAAGKAVPALVSRLDDRAATQSGRTVRDEAREALLEIGKYDLRAVFAALRQKKIPYEDFYSIMSKLGPDDAHASDVLAQESRRENSLYRLDALAGLARIGPKAAAALPDLRTLVNDQDDLVRNAAKRAIAAISPAAADNGPIGGPPFRRPFGEPDPAIARVFGTELRAYKESGYRGVTLGTAYDDLKDKKPTLFREDQPWVNVRDTKGEEAFVFDADKRLVCYTRSYRGGAEDYLDQLVALFGKTDRDPREIVLTNPTWVTRRALVDYTFPKVLVRVVFARAARAEFNRPPTVEEKTHVVVIERAWASAILNSNARGKRQAIEWVRSVGEKVKEGKVALADLPRLDGAGGRESPDAQEVVQFLDDRREEENKRRPEEPRLPAVVAAVEKAPRFPNPDAGPVIRVHFVFERYSPLATPKVFQQDEPQKRVFQPITSNNALKYTPFDDLVVEMNVALVSDYFPPKGEVNVVRPESGEYYYEWRTKDGWLVRCRWDDAVTIEWLGQKGL
jgi:hypothetical protein